MSSDTPIPTQSAARPAVSPGRRAERRKTLTFLETVLFQGRSSLAT